jgi:hypothetical protein
MKARKPPKVCPVCDADVPPDAKACPECGACYDSGWKDNGADDEENEEIDYELLDLPDSAYDEEDRRAMESRRVKRIIPPKWRWIALILVVIWLAWFWWLRGSITLW